MTQLTVQAFLENKWTDIAEILFPNNENNSYRVTELEYETDYAIQHLSKDDHHAVSVNHPVSLFFENDGDTGWMRFLDDIMPSGASRRYWLKHLDIDGLTLDQQNFVLLKFGTMSPVGNLRIKESLPEYHHLAETLFFSIDDVINRASDFLDYAQQRGAAAGGATGAGGEAPKLLLRCNEQQQIWIDTYQNDLENNDTHYLVKFPRGNRTTVDCDILRAEYHYYQELTEMGVNTIATQKMQLHEGSTYPSLWLPRFDIEFLPDGIIKRYSMESVYSLLKKKPGVTLYHDQIIREILAKIQNSHMISEQGCKFDAQAFVIEWVRRDLLNIIFGNSDNHGRNTSFLKDESGIRLTPIYDFAPMKADPDGIARTTKWSPPLEIGGEYDFIAIAEMLADLVPPEKLIRELKETAEQLTGLKERLQTRGVPEQILEMPGIGFNFITQKLSRWGLL
ncbi:MAG: HipA domain-containing protein [Psychromonas sp.]